MTTGSVVRHPGAGCVVEFMHANKPQMAWVLEEQSGKFRLLTLNKREMKLPGGRLLAWAGPQYSGERSRQEMLDLLEQHQARREALAESVDPMELWEFAQGEVDKAPLSWFAELLWTSPEVENADHLAALGRAMLQCKTHFKFTPPNFEIYTAERVEARQAEQAAAEERERISNLGRQFFLDLWDTHKKKRTRPSVPQELQEHPELLARLEDLLRRRISDPDDQETGALWKLVTKGMPDEQHLPLLLAVAWGLIPEHYNFHLDQADLPAGDDWGDTFSDEIEALMNSVLARQETPAPWRALSIDSSSTRDLDDAFAIERAEGGGYLVRLVLACPALGWEFGGPLDKAVAQRATSVYLPEGNIHMLPETLGTDFFSLVKGESKPALVLECLMSADAELLSCSPSLQWVEVAENLTYARVEALLEDERGADGEDGVFYEPCAMAYELSAKLRERRIEQGAIIIDRPDPEIVLEGEGADTRAEIVLKPERVKAQVLVSELMILANSGLALWAQQHETPLLYRTQDVKMGDDAAGVWRRPEEIFPVVKKLGPSLMETRPRRHACLGVDAYSPISSPLRRYSDLINLGQTLHVLEHGVARWSQEELDALLPPLNLRLEAVGRIQRFRPRYWKLLYFKQHDKQLFFGVVIDMNKHLVTVALPREQIFVRGPRKFFGDQVYIGERISVRLGRIDPLHNTIHILDVEDATPEDLADESFH